MQVFFSSSPISYRSPKEHQESKSIPPFHSIRDSFSGNWAAVDLSERSFTAVLEFSECHPSNSSFQSSSSQPHILTPMCHQVLIWTDRIYPHKPSDLCSPERSLGIRHPRTKVPPSVNSPLQTLSSAKCNRFGRQHNLWDTRCSSKAMIFKYKTSNERQDCAVCQSHLVQISAQGSLAILTFSSNLSVCLSIVTTKIRRTNVHQNSGIRFHLLYTVIYKWTPTFLSARLFQ